MNNIKCILLDIDYTLTKNDGTISNYTKEVIKRVKEIGIFVILVTGRPNIYAIQKSKESNTNPIVIADNGALIYNYESEEILYKNEIPKDILSEIWKISLKDNVDCVLNAVNTRYRNIRFADSKYIKTNSFINEINELQECISQIVISSRDYSQMLDFKKAIEKIKEIEITNTNIYTNKEKEYYFYDINKKDNSKGKSILRLLDILNINIDEVICFGDSMNDKSMFDVCINTVAMRNANEELKSMAKYITDYTNDEDGVAKFIEQKIISKKSN